MPLKFQGLFGDFSTTYLILINLALINYKKDRIKGKKNEIYIIGGKYMLFNKTFILKDHC